MKTNAILITIALGLALALVGIGFLLGRASSRPEKVTEIVALPLPFPDTTLLRRISELNPQLVPYPVVSGRDTDTVWIDLNKLALEEYATVDSIPISINQKIAYAVYGLTFHYRGKAEDYRVTPLRNAFEAKTLPRTSPWTAMLLTGFLVDHELRLYEVDLLDGLVGYRRILLHGKILLEPVDGGEDQYNLQWRTVFGVKVRLL